MQKNIKDQAFFCKFSRSGRNKLKSISKITGMSQAELLEKLVEQEYKKLKNNSWEDIYIQLNIFNDQPIDDAATLFDLIPDKKSHSA